MEKKPNTAYNVLMTVIVVLVVLFALFDLWLIRQNRKEKTATTNNTVMNVVNTPSNNTVSNNTTTNTTTNTTSNNTVQNSTTNSTNGTGSSGSANGSTSGAPQVVSSSPASGGNVDSIDSVSVTFDRALDASSTLSVTKVSLPQHVGTGTTTFSSDRKTMTLSVNATSQTEYTVHYTACTGVNVNCTTGSLKFTVGSGGKVPAAERPGAQ